MAFTKCIKVYLSSIKVY